MTLYLSDDKVFYTVEGEGISAGRPAVFLRLSMCNLTCKGWASPENPDGCDTAASWKIKNPYSLSQLRSEFEVSGFLQRLYNGAILKITGGEPLIQQKALLEFLDYCSVDDATSKAWDTQGFEVEIETNCTIAPDDGWRRYRTTFVCSPKLASNGDPEEKRYKPEVIRWHVAKNWSTFKFVIKDPTDIQEILDKYISKFLIPNTDVWLMPECATRQQLIDHSPMVAELCKSYGFNFSPRLQVLIWNQTTKV